MIDPAKVRRLLAISAILFLLPAGGALVAGSPSWAGGLALGFALGALPFASWSWIAARGLSSRGTRLLAAVVMAGKLALYALALYLAVTRGGVSPVGVLLGITGVVLVVTVGALLVGDRPAKETA